MADDKREAGSVVAKAYDDLLHGSASEIGRVVQRAVRLALTPANGVLWTAEQAVEWLEHEVAKRLIARKTPPEHVVPPSPSLLAASIVGVQITAGEETLRSMFANLLATAVAADEGRIAHPSFAEIIRQTHPQEARLLRMFTPSQLDHSVENRAIDATPRELHFATFWPTIMTAIRGTGPKATRIEYYFHDLAEQASCNDAMNVPTYLENLRRLGLLDALTATPPMSPVPRHRILRYWFGEFSIPRVARLAVVTRLRDAFEELRGHGFSLTLAGFAVTSFGRLFLDACVEAEEPPTW